MIPFNKPYLTGKETKYIEEAVASGKISGNGDFTKKCQRFFENRYDIKKALLTSSCTDALEMAAILIDIKKGDEVIMPSYTFVSTANAFILRGAKIVFADSSVNSPNINADGLEDLITSRTKAIVVVHYAGIACEMDKIMQVSEKNNLFVVEDAAQAIDSHYREKPLGSIGHLAAFSFHETKNIISGEGGLLAINDEQFVKRAEVIWEKGTNRSAFFRGEVDKYGWMDIGSSFLPSEVTAAFLWAQLEQLEKIQERRKDIWNAYKIGLTELEQKGKISLPKIPNYATNNAHLFYVLCKTDTERSDLINFLRDKNIHAVFHYLSLHKSPFYKKKHDGRDLIYSNNYSEVLLRLPLFYELNQEQVGYIVSKLNEYYNEN